MTSNADKDLLAGSIRRAFGVTTILMAVIAVLILVADDSRVGPAEPDLTARGPELAMALIGIVLLFGVVLAADLAWSRRRR